MLDSYVHPLTVIDAGNVGQGGVEAIVEAGGALGRALEQGLLDLKMRYCRPSVVEIARKSPQK